MPNAKDVCVQPYCRKVTVKTGEFRGVLCAAHVSTIKSAPQDWLTVIDGLSRNKKKIWSYASALVAFFDRLPEPVEAQEAQAVVEEPAPRLLTAVPEKKRPNIQPKPCRALGCKNPGKQGTGHQLCDEHRQFRNYKGRAGKRGLAKHNAEYSKAHTKTTLRAV
jgi:hypothetical protein